MIERVEDLAIPGVKYITPRRFGDERGYFAETYNRRDFEKIGIDVAFCQDNESFSQGHVVRGLHYQIEPYAQTKLIRVLAGRVLDVAVDLRQGSPTFGSWLSVELDAQKGDVLYLPRGIAHGFAVLSPSVLLSYKCSAYWHPDCERCIAAEDPDLAIHWPLPAADWIRSQKDLSARSWRQYVAKPDFFWNNSSCS